MNQTTLSNKPRVARAAGRRSWVPGTLRMLMLLSLIGICNLSQAQVPSAEVLQGWLYKQVDEGRVSVILPLDQSGAMGKLSRAILEALWKQPNYRANMQHWLATPHVSLVAEDLLLQWRIHLHYALVASFEYLDRDSLSVLWRLDGANGVYDLKRQVCSSDSSELIGRAVRAQHDKLLNSQWQRLAKQLPLALDREYARQNLPYLADRPSPKAMTTIAHATLKAAEDKWSAQDAQRIETHFSQATAEPMSARESCEVSWVTSHVVNDFTGEQADKSVSGTLMRLAIISSAYSTVFARLDAPVGVSRPEIAGFTPGKIPISYPDLVLATGILGDAKYRITVDQTGHAIDTVTLSSTVRPEQLHSIDGSTIATDKLLADVVSAYVRSGFFDIKVENGNAVAFPVDLDYHWQSDVVKR
jgi:hypothetical protein